jgi:hypothetical protein
MLFCSSNLIMFFIKLNYHILTATDLVFDGWQKMSDKHLKSEISCIASIIKCVRCNGCEFDTVGSKAVTSFSCKTCSNTYLYENDVLMFTRIRSRDCKDLQ